MQAIEITKPGGPEVLAFCDRPVPTLGAGDVLIRVRAAAVNRPDIQQRRGLYPPPPGATDLPGLDIAGIVEAVGAGVAWPAAGDKVCALVAGGGGGASFAARRTGCAGPHSASRRPEPVSIGLQRPGRHGL